MLVGCCGWPEGRAAYYGHFPVVELQTTFYQPPSVELARKWRAEAPPGFRFTLKAWQLITHARAVQAPVVVFQCPASFRQTKENRKNLQDFFGSIEREGRLIVWEPRGDWEPEVVSELCRRHAAAGRDPIYVMFNHTAMREDALRFRVLVEGGSGASAS